jgi:hypothetical protein
MDSSRNPFHPKLGDYAVALVILLGSGLVLWPALAGRGATGQRVRVFQADHLVADVSLKDARLLTLRGATVEIKDGAVRIASSECPRGTCRHVGWISEPGRSIVCVPNRILIEVAGKQAPAPYDAVTY